ncbi:MAG: hypothetical protein HQK51_15255 [Oligoflexia bacterium]|nr:hypothetical protein [Oligoflexia bacterium]
MNIINNIINIKISTQFILAMFFLIANNTSIFTSVANAYERDVPEIILPEPDEKSSWEGSIKIVESFGDSLGETITQTTYQGPLNDIRSEGTRIDVSWSFHFDRWITFSHFGDSSLLNVYALGGWHYNEQKRILKGGNVSSCEGILNSMGVRSGEYGKHQLFENKGDFSIIFEEKTAEGYPYTLSLYGDAPVIANYSKDELLPNCTFFSLLPEPLPQQSVDVPINFSQTGISPYKNAISGSTEFTCEKVEGTGGDEYYWFFGMKSVYDPYIVDKIGPTRKTFEKCHRYVWNFKKKPTAGRWTGTVIIQGSDDSSSEKPYKIFGSVQSDTGYDGEVRSTNRSKSKIIFNIPKKKEDLATSKIELDEYNAESTIANGKIYCPPPRDNPDGHRFAPISINERNSTSIVDNVTSRNWSLEMSATGDLNDTFMIIANQGPYSANVTLSNSIANSGGCDGEYDNRNSNVVTQKHQFLGRKATATFYIDPTTPTKSLNGSKVISKYNYDRNVGETIMSWNLTFVADENAENEDEGNER